MYILIHLIALSLVLVGLSCTQRAIVVPDFDGARAMEYLRAQTEFGPRVPGSQAWLDCRTYLAEFFLSRELAVDSQRFSFLDPYSGNDIDLVNLIIHHRGGEKDERALLIAAHWDSRPRTDYPTDPAWSDSAIVGANDGASGVAVLMELANLLHSQPPACNVDLVLVDGEDWGKSGDDDYYLLGARHFAAQGLRDQYRFGVVIDMVGDSTQEIYREQYSDRYVKPLNDYLWSTAARLGLDSFVDTIVHTVLDDHLALNSGGIPSVVLIDFDYAYWHTDQDTPDKCSAASLEKVGRLLTHVVYHPWEWPEL